MPKLFVLVGLLVTLGFAAPASAHDPRHRVGHGRGPHGRVVVGVRGPIWWGPPFGYYGWGPPPVYVYDRPRVVVREPTVYIEAEPEPQAPTGFWYYCPSARGYYPSVATCSEPWLKVAPRPE